MRLMLSIRALWKYDQKVFEDFTLPPEMDSMRKDLIEYICAVCEPFSVIYPNPEIMKAQIGIWSRANNWNWKKLYNITLLQYDPIENYNRQEDITLTDKWGRKNKIKDDTTQKYNEIMTGSIGTDNTDTLTQKNSAYNNNDPALTHIDTNTSKGTNSTSSTHTTQGEGNQAFYNRDDTLSGEDTHTTKAHLHGNIGVTSSQDMILQEMEVARLNIVETIAQSFKKRFCVAIYQ